MASFAASKWSMSVHSDARFMLKLKLQTRRWFYVLAIPILILYCMVLCGCVSNNSFISNIYIVELEGSIPQGSKPIRIGYFGLCTLKNDGKYACSSTMLSSTKELSHVLKSPEPVTQYAIDLQRIFSFVILSTAGLIFLAGLITLFALHILRRKQKPYFLPKEDSKLDGHISNLTLAARVLLWISAGVSLVAPYALHCAISILQVAVPLQFSNAIGGKVTRGTVLEIMQWIIFALSALFSTVVQLATRPSKRSRYLIRKSRLDAMQTESETKIGSQPSQRLAQIGTNNLSQQSLYKRNQAQANISRSNSMKPLLSAEQKPPLATLQRRPTINKQIGIGENRAVSPLLPSPVTAAHPPLQRNQSPLDRIISPSRQNSPFKARIDDRLTISPLSPSFYNDMPSPVSFSSPHRTPIPGDQFVRPSTPSSARQTPSQRSMRAPGTTGGEEKPVLSPGLPLLGILKSSTPSPTVGGTALHSTSPRGMQKNIWD